MASSMTPDFSGTCAVITGGGAGIGLSVALAFARAGGDVVISGRRAEVLADAARQIEAAGGRVVTVTADAGKREDAQKTIDAAIAAFGRLDFLINNAHSTGHNAPLGEIDDESWAMQVGSGLGGTLHHIQAAMPHLKASKGAIVNFGSRQGTYGAEGFGAYAAAKEGIRGLTRTAARELGPFGIRVNVICPAAESEASRSYLDANPGLREFFINQASLRRFGDSDRDIAPVVLFLCSDAAGYVTGQTIHVDGGQEME